MFSLRATICCLAVLGAIGLQVDTDDQSLKVRPVSKVINLLKEMKAEIEKEAEKDEALFDNFQCWCQTYDKEKTAAIDTANQRIDEYTAGIEEMTAKKAQLETDIERLGKENVQKKKALEEASAIRAKESAEFTAGETDLSASIKGLGGAVKALGAAHGEALPQTSMIEVQHLLKRHMDEHKTMFGERREAVMSLLQQPVAANSYNSQSGAIFGILKQMHETFQSNLAEQTSDEKQATQEYGDLKSAKTKEMAAASDQIEANTIELANTKQKLIDTKQDLEDTRAALEADTAFLADLKAKCADMDKAWEARSKMRNDEITATSEAIEILDHDDAHDQFSKSLGFIQQRASSTGGLRRRVAAYLMQQGVKLHSKHLSLLAVSAKEGPEAFDAVKENIEGLIETLKTTQEEEAKERDFCINEINENEDQTTAASLHRDDLTQKIEDLTQAIAAAKEVIDQSKQEILYAQVAMKQAGGNRLAENKEFQVTVGDQRASQEILTKALKRLEQFYESKAALLQKQEPGAEAPDAPEGFGEYKKAGGSAGAMGLIKMIIKESAATERQAVEDENNAQKDYEQFMKESAAAVAKLQEEITDKTEEIAVAEGRNTVAQTDLANTQDDLNKLNDYSNQLHKRCDYLLDNFEIRKSSRAQEIDSLNNAKAMFSGADFGL